MSDEPLNGPAIRDYCEPDNELLEYYCVYRGRKEHAIHVIETALKAMKALAVRLGNTEPEVSPDDGKKYA
jgi:hypothetical protein